MTTRHQAFLRETRERRMAFLTSAIVLMAALGALAYILARLAATIARAIAILP